MKLRILKTQGRAYLAVVDCRESVVYHQRVLGVQYRMRLNEDVRTPNRSIFPASVRLVGKGGVHIRLKQKDTLLLKGAGRVAHLSGMTPVHEPTLYVERNLQTFLSCFIMNLYRGPLSRGRGT
jgi:hypothetical protein